MKNLFTRFLALMLTMLMLFACASCAQAATLSLPSGLKAIEAEAFSGAVMLDTVVLPEGITAIGSRAFADSSLTSINLPRSITSIAADAFENSPNVKAYVKSGSYAHTFCAENGVDYEVETVVLPSSGIPVSVTTTQTTVVMGEEALELTFSSDNGEELGEYKWYDYSIVYLNAAGEVIDAVNYGDSEFGTWSYWLECAGAAKAIITVVNSEYACPGKNPSVEVTLTGSDSYVYYDWNIVGYGYPGGKVRFSLVAMNADKMTGAQTVTLTDEVGSFKKTGTLSASSPKFATDVTIPADWKCYDENFEYQEYALKYKIGDQTTTVYLDIEPLCDSWVSVREGKTTSVYTRVLPSEMPYTFSIKNESIATIDDQGVVTGVAAGTTTGTVTGKSGITENFTVEVLEDPSSGEGGDTESPVNEPVFYVTAASESIFEGEDDAAVFYICSETENSLWLETDIEYQLSFYDENEELIETIFDYRWIETDNNQVTIWSQWDWWYDFLEEGKCRYIEFSFGDLDYAVTEPSTARVTVINPEALGKLAFKLNDKWGIYNAGDTVTIPLTCTTKNLLAAKGSATVKPVAVYTNGLDIIRDVTVASFDADTLTANVTFTVGEDAVPGEYYNIQLYCGSDRVGDYSVEIFSGLSRVAYNVHMLVGESRPLPIMLAEGANYDNLHYEIEDPSVVSIDRDGVVTALGEGYTEVRVYYDCGYGYTSSEWINIVVYEPVSESPAVLTVTPLADSAVFGKTLPVQVKLSELATDEAGNPARIEFMTETNFLDKNKNVVMNNGRWYDYTADQLMGEGVTVNLNMWSSGSDVCDAAYVTVTLNGDSGNCIFDYDYTVIPLTGVPEYGETIWNVVPENDGAISQGNSVGFNVYRLPMDIGHDSEIALCDADGNVLKSATYWDDTYSMWMSFSSRDLEIGEHTVYLYVDGQKMEGVSSTFTIEEPQVKLNGYSSRMAIGDTRTLGYYYNTDYDCEITFSSSNPEVAAITDGNHLTALAAGTTTISATCAHGKSASREMMVFNPNGSFVPEVYILSGENSEIEWMDAINLILGTESDVLQIPEYELQVPTNVQLLDENGRIVYDQYEDKGWYAYLYHDLCESEGESSWNNDSAWLTAAELGARYIRFEILAKSGAYTVDADRSAVTLEIPPLDEYPYPVVTVDYPSTIQQGSTVDVTFTCLNPNSLTRSREVYIQDYNDGARLATGWLTKENPVVTLSHDPGEGFTGGGFQYGYPLYENGFRSSNFYVNVSSYTGLGSDTKIAVGGKDYMYPLYTGSMPELTVTSSDESVATAEMYGSYAMSGMARDGGYVIVTGVGAGTATITGTDQNGVSHSFTVVVYDPNNTVTPVLGFDQTQSGEVPWQGFFDFTVVTANEPHTFGKPGVYIHLEYLDAEGNVLDTDDAGQSTQNGFIAKEDIARVYTDTARLAQAYAEGARSVRYTLHDGVTYGYNYTVDENAASVTLTIADPHESETPIVYYELPDYTCAGSAFDITLGCVNPDSLGEGVVCSAKRSGDADYESVTLTPSQPTASISLPVPADYTGSYYHCSLEVGDIDSYSFSRPILRGRFNTYASTLRVGCTYNFYVSLDLYFEGLTTVWESSNPEVATVDQDGLVTGVSAGMTNIMVHYGPLTISHSMRVYDPYGEIITPELYITSSDEAQALMPNSAAKFRVGTDSDITKLGSGVSVEYTIDYLDADGNVVEREEYNSSNLLVFAEGNIENLGYSLYDSLASSVAAGATQVRIRLLERPNYYTVDPARASVVIPIKDPAEWNSIWIACGTPVLYRGENTLRIKLVSTTASSANTDFALTLNITDQNGKALLENAAATVNMASPDADFSFTIPENVNSVSISCRYESTSNSGTRYFYPSLVYLTQEQPDTALAIGEQSTATYYGMNLGAVERSYESSNPNVVTVDDEGVFTAVSAGVAAITARFGSLEYTFDVRVYDPEGTYATPNLYMISDSSQIVAANTATTLTFGTTTNVTELGGGVYAQIFSEYLNAEGETVYEGSSYGRQIAFAVRNETSISIDINSSDVNYALACGATQARFSIRGNTYNFTVDAERASVTVPLEDPNLRTYTSVAWNRLNSAAPGQEITLNVSLLSLSESDADEDFICTLYVRNASNNYIIDYEEQTINNENRTASYTFTIPETGFDRYYYAGYSVRRASSSYASYSSNNTIYVLSFSSTQSDLLLDIGASQQARYSGNNLSYVTARYESSNPDVATVDQNGYVTGVSAGTATITARFGQLIDTFDVRIVDPNGTFSTPELYLAVGDMQAVVPNEKPQVVVGTTTNLSEIRGYPYVQIYYEYLDADGNLADTTTNYSTFNVPFITSPEPTVTFDLHASTLELMYMKGARQIRFSLYERPADYTVDAERASVILPIADPADWNYNAFIWDFYGYPTHGENTVNVHMLSADEAQAGQNYVCTLYVRDGSNNYFIDNEERIISAENPVVSYTYTLPETCTYVYAGYSIKPEGSSGITDSETSGLSVAYFTSTQNDIALAVGATQYVSYSGGHINNLTKSFESSNPEVVAIDNSGKMTGIAAGVATITAHYGTLVDTFDVRVYDESAMVNAKLSLTAPETLTQWNWDGKGQLILSADQPVENLGSISNVSIQSYFYNDQGTLMGSQYINCAVSMITENQVTLDIANSNMINNAKNGVVRVKHELYSYTGKGFSFDGEAKAVELPMQALADYPDPMLYADSLSSTSMVSGKEYTLPVHAVNYAMAEPVTVAAYTNISGLRYDLGSVTFTPSESVDATLTITAPSGVTASSFTLYVVQQKADGTETQIGSSYSCALTALPTLTTVTTLAELQSAHPYANNMNRAWAYTVEGAASLSVTFDSQTRTESTYYDPLKVGSLAAFENGSPENTYGSSIGAITVEVSGDTVVIWLKSDGSSTYYGFAVTQIVATMADGSTVTITE